MDRFALRDRLGDLVDLIVPPRCLLCGADSTPRNRSICHGCWDSLPRLAEPVCVVCGVPRPGRLETCAACRAQPRAFRCARAVAPYDGALLTLIQRFKYGPAAALARPLARLLVERDPFVATAFDVVVAVPLAPRRLRHRGFNQAALLARGFAAARDARYVSRALARRSGGAVSQAASGRGARLENVSHAFTVRRPSSIAGLRVLLVDDVVTTGATAGACAQALASAGAASVDVLAVARTGQGLQPSAAAFRP